MLSVATFYPLLQCSAVQHPAPHSNSFMLRRLFLAQRRFFTDARLKIATLIIELAHLPVGHSLFDIRHWIFAFASITNTEHPMSNNHQLLSTRFPGYSAFVIQNSIFAFASITTSC
jgi:hypothetical protein